MSTANDKKTILWPDGQKMVYIPAGQCLIGSEELYSEEAPVHSFETKGFYMDTTPVTNACYKRFCDETERPYPIPVPWPGVKDYFNDYPDYPVVNVSFGDCAEYAKWAGKRLPKEEEWEYAARGGDSKIRYPWGNEPPFSRFGALANFADSSCDEPWRCPVCNDGYKFTSPVGSYPENKFGLYDMSGNVHEYVDDWYFLYSDNVKSEEGFNDGWGGERVCRGGSFLSVEADIRVSSRHRILGGDNNEAVGFRCVSDTAAVPESACKAGTKAVAADASSEKTPEKSDNFDSLINGILPPGNQKELCAGIGAADSGNLNKLKKLGFTSVEQYVTWRSCEEKGFDCWDFSHWDNELKKINDAGLKWLPFIIIGPAYSLPDWYLYSKDHTGLCCLEHGIESKVQSFWDENFRLYIDRFLKKFSEHFCNRDGFEGILFGISGDFGEAITSVWHGNWPTKTAGTYHAHSGFWCFDKYARIDFKEKMKSKYSGDIKALNLAWDTDFTDFCDVTFPKLSVSPDDMRMCEFTNEGILPTETDAERVQTLDFVDWYRESMSEYVDFFMKTAAEHLAPTKLYLCTGGEAQPCHASEFAAQCKACAKHLSGVRITNEDSHFEKNFVITDWVASAGSFYGCDFSFEPAGQITERGTVCRIYNAAATGAKGLHFYESNLLSDDERLKKFAQNIEFFNNDGIKRDIALFYPDTAMMLEKQKRADMYSSFSAMRDFSDYLFADDLTVKDGILNNVKALVLTVGGYYRMETLEAFESFVKEGGIIVGIGIDKLLSIQGEGFLERLFCKTGIKQIGKGETLFIKENLGVSGGLCDRDIDILVFDKTADFMKRHGIYISDGKRDRLYTAEKGGGLLVMNYSKHGISRELSLPGGEKKTVSLGDSQIVFVK